MSHFKKHVIYGHRLKNISIKNYMTYDQKVEEASISKKSFIFRSP